VGSGFVWRAWRFSVALGLILAVGLSPGPASAQETDGPALAVPPALPSLPTIAGDDHARAVECLALAITYEAGHEPIEGQRAVAEVILNRLRSPAYPKTVCGVVFAGGVAGRRTGCQFTFTCDGSLNRRLPPEMMARSRAIAESVLSGTLAPVVPGATHYHAAYVSPYWAPSLVKLVRIGLHIFYRAPGGVPGFAAPGASVPAGEIPDGLMTALQGAPRAATGPATPPAKPQVFAPWGL